MVEWSKTLGSGPNLRKGARVQIPLLSALLKLLLLFIDGCVLCSSTTEDTALLVDGLGTTQVLCHRRDILRQPDQPAQNVLSHNKPVNLLGPNKVPLVQHQLAS